MSYFSHSEFGSVLADLSLQPLSAHEVAVLRRLVDGEEIDVAFPCPQEWEAAACHRLEDIGLVWFESAYEEWEPDYAPRATASALLKAIAERGLLPQIGVH